MTAARTVIEGRCWIFGDDVDTDAIISARYLGLRDDAKMAEHAMESLDPTFGVACRPGDIVVAGESFGAGSSREAAARVFKTLGVGAIVVASYARIFFRNAINNGLYAVEAPGVQSIAEAGRPLQIDLHQGSVRNPETNAIVRISPWSPMILALVEEGGLVPFLKSGRRDRVVE